MSFISIDADAIRLNRGNTLLPTSFSSMKGLQ